MYWLMYILNVGVDKYGSGSARDVGVAPKKEKFQFNEIKKSRLTDSHIRQSDQNFSWSDLSIPIWKRVVLFSSLFVRVKKKPEINKTESSIFVFLFPCLTWMLLGVARFICLAYVLLYMGTLCGFIVENEKCLSLACQLLNLNMKSTGGDFYYVRSETCDWWCDCSCHIRVFWAPHYSDGERGFLLLCQSVAFTCMMQNYN